MLGWFRKSVHDIAYGIGASFQSAWRLTAWLFWAAIACSPFLLIAWLADVTS